MPVCTLLFGDRFPFRYLVDDYGLNDYAAFSGCSAESEASFETVVFLAGKVDELGLTRVLTIEGTNHRIAETIVATGEVKKLDYPESDVLYFAMEGGHFVCVRPSGTEPKIKLYVNVNDKEEAKAKDLLATLTAAAQQLLK